ncbi:fungal-specific transcription factor domain-containing protein [Colletotrichum somersetense]|nr:fungal-specific transcription factor domain-containing protein [Colletotrichum somersetense]
MNGQPYFLGSSSNWSFSRQVLSVTHEHVCQSPLPTNSLLFDGCVYDLRWNGSRTTQTLDSRSIPSYDYAIFLINAVKFHCGQMFHLFEEDKFMDNMQNFYSKSSIDRVEEDGLWLIHFLVILSFGRSLIQRKSQGKRPAGAEFFVRALQLLPDIGQAKSVAMNHGMYTDMPVMDLGSGPVQRYRRIWWTVHVLDPANDFSGSAHRTAALSMQIKFARIIANISSTVYGANGRLNKKFVLSTKAVLQSIVAVSDELRNSFPLYAGERFDESQSPWLEKSNSILEEMIVSGNLIAEFRKNEMQQLAEMLVEFEAAQPRALSGFDIAPTGSSGQHKNTGPQTSAEDLTTQQIIDVVNSLEWEDNEWMSLTMIEEGG